MSSVLLSCGEVEPIEVLFQFRLNVYDCLDGRANALFEVTEALLCADGPVRSLVELSLAPEHRRGHGCTNACTTAEPGPTTPKTPTYRSSPAP